uniref:Uncharacterized protein n=1 Tax=Neospora caninum (strain Liverpool) TaxID=572307 RepID=F0JB48_NEOCL|nr:hypothetical protein, conserved [Neospora caninum Liverpool]CEL71315.1 TPA: hypothetical protein, conserved [Neospora caninum Liverpool]
MPQQRFSTAVGFGRRAEPSSSSSDDEDSREIASFRNRTVGKHGAKLGEEDVWAEVSNSRSQGPPRTSHFHSSPARLEADVSSVVSSRKQGGSTRLQARHAYLNSGGFGAEPGTSEEEETEEEAQDGYYPWPREGESHDRRETQSLPRRRSAATWQRTHDWAETARSGGRYVTGPEEDPSSEDDEEEQSPAYLQDRFARHPQSSSFQRSDSFCGSRSRHSLPSRGNRDGESVASERGRTSSIVEPTVRKLQESSAREVMATVVEPRLKWQKSLKAFQSCLRMEPSEEETVGYESDEEEDTEERPREGLPRGVTAEHAGQRGVRYVSDGGRGPPNLRAYSREDEAEEDQEEKGDEEDSEFARRVAMAAGPRTGRSVQLPSGRGSGDRLQARNPHRDARLARSHWDGEDEDTIYRGENRSRWPRFTATSVSPRSFVGHTPREDSEDEEEQLAELKTYVNKKLSALDRNHGPFRGPRKGAEDEGDEGGRALAPSRKAYRGTLLAALAPGFGTEDDKRSPRSPHFGSADDTDGGEETVSSPSFGAKFPGSSKQQTREMFDKPSEQGATLLSSSRPRLTSQGDADTSSTLTSTPRADTFQLSSPAFPSSFSASFPPSEPVAAKEKIASGFPSRIQQMVGSAEEGEAEEEDGMQYISEEEQEAKLKALQDRYMAKYAELKRAPVLSGNTEDDEEAVEVQISTEETQNEPEGDEESVEQAVEEESACEEQQDGEDENCRDACEEGEGGADGDEDPATEECGEHETVEAEDHQANEDEEETEVNAEETGGDVGEVAEEQDEAVADASPDEPAEECAEEHEAEAGDAKEGEESAQASPPRSGDAEEKDEKSHIKSQVVEALQDVLLSVLRPPSSLPSNSVPHMLPIEAPASSDVSGCAPPTAVAARGLLAALLGRAGSVSSCSDSKEPLALTEISPRGVRENEHLLQSLENPRFASAESILVEAAAGAVMSGTTPRPADMGDGVIRSVLPSPRDHPSAGGPSEAAWKIPSGPAVTSDWSISFLRRGREGDERRRDVSPRGLPVATFPGFSAAKRSSFGQDPRELSPLADVFPPVSGAAIAGGRFAGASSAASFVGETQERLPFDCMRAGQSEEGQALMTHVQLLAGLSGGFQADKSAVTAPYSSMPGPPEGQKLPQEEEERSSPETDRPPQIPSTDDSPPSSFPSSSVASRAFPPVVRALSEARLTTRLGGRLSASLTGTGKKGNKDRDGQAGTETAPGTGVARRTSMECPAKRDRLSEIRRQLKERAGCQEGKPSGEPLPVCPSSSDVFERLCASRPTTPRETATPRRHAQSFFSFDGLEAVPFPALGELKRQLVSQQRGPEEDLLTGKGAGSADILALLAGSTRRVKSGLPVPPPGRPRHSGWSETETGKTKTHGPKADRTGQKSSDVSQDLPSWIELSPDSRTGSSVALCTTTAGGSSPRGRERTVSGEDTFEDEEQDEVEEDETRSCASRTKAGGSSKRGAEAEKKGEKKRKEEARGEVGEQGRTESKRLADKATGGKGRRGLDKRKVAEAAYQSEAEQTFRPTTPSGGDRRSPAIVGHSKRSRREKKERDTRHFSSPRDTHAIVEAHAKGEVTADEESEATRKLQEAQKRQQEMEARTEEQTLLLTAAQKHVQEVHKELERLARENSTLQEEKQQQELKVRQIMKSASRTNLQLLALKAQQPAWERLKKSEEQHHELEALEKELESLKKSVLERTSREHGTIVDLRGRLAATEQLLKERTEAMDRRQAEGEAERRTREALSMQVEEWRVRHEAQTETLRRLTARLGAAEQAKTQLENKLADMLKLMERVKAALVATRNEAAEHKRARESAEKELIWKHAKSVSCAVQTETTGVKHSGMQADLKSSEKNVTTVGVQVGHPTEKSLLGEQDHAREQKLASALAKQKQLTMQVRSEHKKRASAWSAEKAELQAFVISLQGRIAELEKIQKLAMGSKSSVNPPLVPYHMNPFPVGCAPPISSLCPPGMAVASSFAATPFPLPPVSHVPQTLREGAKERDTGRQGARRNGLLSAEADAPEFAEQEEQALLDFVSDLIQTEDAVEAREGDGRVAKGKEHDEPEGQQPRRREDARDTIAADLRAMGETVRVLEDQLDERLRILGTLEDEELDAQGENRGETEAAKKVESAGGVAWSIDEKHSSSEKSLRSGAHSALSASPRTVPGTAQSRSKEASVSCSVSSRLSPVGRIDSLLATPLDSPHVDAGLSALEETGTADRSFPGANGKDASDFMRRGIDQILANKNATSPTARVPQTSLSGGKNPYDSIAHLLTESRRENRATSSAREKVQELRRQLREHGVLS